MHQLKLFLAVLGAAAALSAAAEIPAGYYDALDGKSDAALKTACYGVVRHLSRVSSYSALPQYFQKTDVYPGTDRWWDMYSDIPLYAPVFTGLNREHSFPKSWWGGNTDVNAYVDLNHLYPSEAAANQAKNNYPLGVVDRASTLKFDNGVSLVGYPVTGQGGGATYVFEPDDEYKGDFARTYFYMVTCYQNLTWNTRYMYMLQQDDYPTLKPWSVDLLLKWSREDPVSQKEVDRNEAVYGFQHNRNPFIDFPALAEYIWGDRRGMPFDLAANGGWVTDPDSPPVLVSPQPDMSLDLGQVAIGGRVTSRLFFHGRNLPEDVGVVVYSGDAPMFGIPSESIPAYLVNSSDGYWLNVSCEPSKLGVIKSKLLIRGGGLDQSRTVTLMAECLPRPELGVCTATAPTDITASSYMANWTAPENDVIDYFVVTRTIYSGGHATEQTLVAEENSLLIDDFDRSDRESYYVQSSRLGFLSIPSNVVFVDHSGITGVECGEPLVVMGIEGAIRFICSSPQTNAMVYDPAGRLVAHLPLVENNTDLPLPLGIYLVVTDQSRTPHKVAIN